MKKQMEGVTALPQLRAEYSRLVAVMMTPNAANLQRITLWFERSHKYLEYFGRGGESLLREPAMEHFDLSTLSQALEPASVGTFVTEAKQVHELNWILIRATRCANPSRAIVRVFRVSLAIHITSILKRL